MGSSKVTSQEKTTWQQHDNNEVVWLHAVTQSWAFRATHSITASCPLLASCLALRGNFKKRSPQFHIALSLHGNRPAVMTCRTNSAAGATSSLGSFKTERLGEGCNEGLRQTSWNFHKLCLAWFEGCLQSLTDQEYCLRRARHTYAECGKEVR